MAGQIGVNIKRLRLEKEMTQATLAAIVETHVNYLGSIETGARDPGKKLIAKLAKALDVDEMTLRFSEEEIKKATALSCD